MAQLSTLFLAHFQHFKRKVGNNREDDRRAVIKEKAQLAVRLRKQHSRDRTHIGSPKVRDSFTAEDIDLFNKYNDGFPVPLAELGDGDDVFQEIPAQISAVPEDARQRSRSLPDIQAHSVTKPVKVPSKPTLNFFQKFFPGKPKGRTKGLLKQDKSKAGVQLLAVCSVQKIADPVGIPDDQNRLSDINEEHSSQRHSKSTGATESDQNSSNSCANSNDLTKSSATCGDSRGDNSNSVSDSKGDNRKSSTSSVKKRRSSSGKSTLRKMSSSEKSDISDGAYDNQICDFKRRLHIYEDVDSEGERDQRNTSSSGSSDLAYENVQFGGALKKNSGMTQSIIEFEWDSDSFSDFSDFSDCEESSDTRSSRTGSRISEPTSKCHRIALEILTTERAYVDRLRLLDQVFRFKIDLENRSNPMFPQDVVKQMFSNVNSLYHLHQEFLLQPLEKRLVNWSEKECLGDIMLTVGPFLIMYTEYIKNFDQSMYLIDHYSEKSRRFATLIDEIQKTSECGMLTLQHHLLEPIQRVPRYELLMKDYLKHLPENSADRPDCTKALEHITRAANHANDAMRTIDKFRKLLEINEQLGDDINLITPTRELVKEGPVKKVSAKNRDLLDRYIFLFNDMFLVCSIQGRKSYKMRARLDIDGMTTHSGDDDEPPNTFHVQTKQKSFEFIGESLQEAGDWQVAIWRCVTDLKTRQETFMTHQTDTGVLSEHELGKKRPSLYKDLSVTVCMLCNRAFSAFRRRHNCRACGIIVCGTCSGYKVALQYDDFKISRVCKKCFRVLKDKRESTTHSEDDLDTSKADNHKKGVLQIKADDPSLICGYLQVSNNRGRSWDKRWYAIHDTFVMYSFKSDKDLSAMSSTPLPGHAVSTPVDTDNIQQEHVFKLFHKDNASFYQAQNTEELERWLTVLQYVTKAELPPLDDQG